MSEITSEETVPTKSGKPRSRRNLALPQTSVATIQAIRAKTEASSDTEVIRNALKLYGLLVEKEGHVVVKDHNGNDVRYGALALI